MAQEPAETPITFQRIGACKVFSNSRLVFHFLTPFCGLRQPTIVFNQAPVMGQGSNQMMWDTENWKFSFFSCVQALALHLGRPLPVIL